MTIHNYSAEFGSPISPARLFKASVLHWPEFASKIMPDVVTSGAIVEGDGGPGTIKEYLFNEEAGLPFKYAKQRVEELDRENLVCKYCVMEGGTLGVKYKSATYVVKIEAGANGGSVCKLAVEIQELDGVEFTEEDRAKSKEGSIGTYKAIDAYLQANPDAYA